MRLRSMLVGVVVCGLVCTAGGSAAAQDPFDTYGPLNADQFHAIGEAVGARPLDPDETVAEALGVDQGAVNRYVEGLCAGDQLSLIATAKLMPFPSDVPAYEVIFYSVASECGVPEATLDRARGFVADQMVSAQQIGENIRRFTQGKANRFCRRLEGFEDITSKVLGALVKKVFKLSDDGAQLAELGVAVVIDNCSELLD